MKKLALLSAFPLLAFMLAYSIDMGCFICLYGDERGGAAEKWINAALAAALGLGLGALLLRHLRQRRP